MIASSIPASAVCECAGPTDRPCTADAETPGDWHARSSLAASIDLEGCDARGIRDAARIRQFALALSALIAEPPCGEPIVARLGAGHSLILLSERSIISGHFVEASGDAYIDLFGCRSYSPYQVAEFCRGWFGAASMRINLTRAKVEAAGGTAARVSLPASW